MGPVSNLATQFTSGERAKEMGRRGGKVKSLKKTTAAVLRERIKKYNRDKEITTGEADEMLEFITNPELGISQIHKGLLKAKPMLEHSPQGTLHLHRLLIDLHKQAHGTKQTTRNENINYNVVVDELKDKMNKIFNDD